MVIYEVNCLVDTDIASEFEIWLRLHVDAIVNLDGFNSGKIFDLVQDARLDERTGSKGFSVRYELDSIDSLNHYLEHHADVMRKDGLDRFGTRFSAYRRVLSA